MDISSLIQSQGLPQAQPQTLGGVAALQNTPAHALPRPLPAPTHEQAVAGYHRAEEIKRLMGRILESTQTGHENIRPLVLDAGAVLVGEKIMSLAELMSGLKDFPPADDPLSQKKWVQRLVAANSMAQRKLLADHRAANAADWQHGTPWSADDHSNHMAGLMAHYPS